MYISISYVGPMCFCTITSNWYTSLSTALITVNTVAQVSTTVISVSYFIEMY